MKQSTALLSMISLVAVTVNVFAEDKQAITGTEIIAKHIAAVGGAEAIAKFKSRVAVGTVKKENEPDANMAIVSEAPNRVSAVYVFRNYNWQLTYDGSKTIFRPQVSKDASVVEDKQREMLATGAMFNSISLYSVLIQPGSDVKFDAKGTKKVKGRPAYVVEAKVANKPSVLLYFDAESFMWVRTDYGRVRFTKSIGTFSNNVVQHGEDETEVEFYFETSDFREVDGVKLPFRFEQVVASPIIRQKRVGTIIGTISEYKHNVPIDPKMFQ
ncbi:MAG TPA: hypothetical protein VKN18_13950 [Blastocatellia bacterium]|nr:hypothetical protein [Blastocatellia bacterium]